MVYLQVEKQGPSIPLKNANTVWKKFKGLMFQKNIEQGIIFEEFSVHMMFMKEAIDIIMLDKKSNIIKLFPNAQPWKFFKIVPKCKVIVELPKGSIEKYGITEESNLYIKIDKKKNR